ncbi:MAG TPA: NUDIX domain-containing protein [Lysobacter sp.]|nr:NUDIX domain-containing protein [Lysobacter sp.]
MRSAGILLYRRGTDGVQVLLAHPGGPFWRGRDAGAWTLPKGEVAAGESPDSAARREFAEETGLALTAALQPLGTVRQRGGKQVEAFAAKGEFDPAALRSNHFELEWPPRSGRRASFPEIDRVAWFTLPEARRRILPAQQPLLDRLEALLDAPDA